MVVSHAKKCFRADENLRVRERFSLAIWRRLIKCECMFTDAFRNLSKPHVLSIVEELKKSQGMTVADLARNLDMSYMGVKQHVVKLEEMGYVKTWRVPRKESGRPEKLYVLTALCDPMFPQAGVDLSLNVMEGVRKFFGDSAPEKILFHHYEQLRASWAPFVSKGKSLVEKATRLVDLRDKVGCFSRCHYSPKTGFRIEEYHHPMQEIFDRYPSAIQQEIRMMEFLLGSKVQRKVILLEKGGSMVIYTVGVLG